ncbi:MAG: F0F1 ATP synthase subunit B [Anaerovoracaceae bacterium]
MEYSPLISFNWTFLMQIITVVVFFLILKKFFFEKVHNFIKAREESVKDAFDNAEAVNRKADEKMEVYSRKIAKYESDGREVIHAAKVKAEQQAQRLIDEANLKSSEIIMAAQREIERERHKALEDMKSEISTLALLAAAKIIEEDIKAGDKQEAIVDKIIEEAGKTGWQN